jgi:hypothetical protein
VHDKPCDLQEQRFVAQIVLHPQLMSSINASRLLVHPVNRQHIFRDWKVYSNYCKYEDSNNKTLSTELVDTKLFQQVKILK